MLRHDIKWTIQEADVEPEATTLREIIEERAKKLEAVAAIIEGSAKEEYEANIVQAQIHRADAQQLRLLAEAVDKLDPQSQRALIDILQHRIGSVE